MNKEYEEQGLDYVKLSTLDKFREILEEAMQIYDTGNLSVDFEVKHTGTKEWTDEDGKIKEIINTYTIVGTVNTEPSRVYETV